MSTVMDPLQDDQLSTTPEQQATLEHYAHVQRVDETIFLVLQVVGGQVFLPLLVLVTIFSKKIKRHPIFTNFCISWIISSIFNSLLVYRGRSSANELSLNPPKEECLVQAAFMNGAQALTSCTTLALVVHLFIVLRSCISKKEMRMMWFGPSTATYILLAFPLFAFMAFTIATTVVGNKPIVMSGVAVPNSTLAVPTVFYCFILQNADFTTSVDAGFMFLRVVYSLVAAISIICFIFEVMVAMMVYRNRVHIRKNVAEGWLQMFIRVILFSFYRMVAVSLNFAIIAQPDEIILTGLSKNNLYNGVIDFVQAAIPLVAFLVFGTDRQFMEVWCFWKRFKRPTPPETSVEETNTTGKSSTESNQC